MKKVLLVVLCVFIMAVSVMGCSATPEGVVGTWKQEATGESIEFKEGGTYSMGEYTGQYTIDGKSVVLHRPDGAPDYVEDYELALDGDKLMNSSNDVFATRK